MNRVVLGVLMLLAGLAPSLAGAANAVSVEAALSAGTIRVGDQVTLRLTVTHEPQIAVQFPDLTDGLGSLEVVRRHAATIDRPNQSTQVSITDYVITGFIPGHHRLPRLAVQYTTPDGSPGHAEAPGDLAVEVVSLVADPATEPLKDIKPPALLARPASTLVQPGAAAALAGSAAALALLLARHMRRRPEPASIPALDPAGRARQALSEAGAMALQSPADYVEYYTRLSLTIRHYLDARFSFDAASSTTHEIEQVMEDRGMDRWQARIVAVLLEECDAVKWAHYLPDAARAGRALTNAFEVIELAEGRHAAVPAR